MLEIQWAPRIRTFSPAVMSFGIPEPYRPFWADLIKKGVPKGDVYTLKVGLPFIPRSTGYRSENSHTHGHYADIAEQLSNAKVTYTPEEIGRSLKVMAMKEGYWPSKKDIDGNTVIDPITRQLEPMSEADSSMGWAAKLIEYVHGWADMNGLWLTEYVNNVSTRVYGGSREV